MATRGHPQEPAPGVPVDLHEPTSLGVLGSDHSLFNSLVALSTVALMHIWAATLKQRFAMARAVENGSAQARAAHC